MASKGLTTALIRIQKGRLTVLGSSKGFPFPYESLPEDASDCPAGTGVYEIISGQRTEFKGEVPMERWFKQEYLNLNGRRYVLREHTILLPGQILTLLEIEEFDSL